jgi:serine/threonine protein phosphatase PrpC
VNDADEKALRSAARTSAPPTVAFAERTDVGRRRDENQDAVAHADFEPCSLFVVCDGMGGHAGGSTASRLAADTILATFATADPDLPHRERLERAILAANKAVFQAARSDRALKGMGTTAVTLLLDPDEGTARIAHVGDSRAYLARDGQLRRLTRDHTMVQQMVDDGLLTHQQAAGHPHGNVISRSLGGGRTVDVEHVEPPLELQAGDLFLLCTDGLTGPVPEPEIAEILWGNKPKAAAAALVARANAAGGEDNVSVQVIRFGPQPAKPETIEVIHPEGRPSGLLDELRRRSASLASSGAATRDGRHGLDRDALEHADTEDEPPLWPNPPGARSELTSPVLPALVLGLFLAMVAFLAIYLGVDRVTQPIPQETAPVEEGDGVEPPPAAPPEDEGAPF